MGIDGRACRKLPSGSDDEARLHRPTVFMHSLLKLQQRFNGQDERQPSPKVIFGPRKEERQGSNAFCDGFSTVKHSDHRSSSGRTACRPCLSPGDLK